MKFKEIEQHYVEEIKWTIAHGQWSSPIESPGQLNKILELIPSSDMEVSTLLFERYRGYIHFCRIRGWYMWDGVIHERLGDTEDLGMGMVLHYTHAFKDVVGTLKSQVFTWQGDEAKAKGFKLLGDFEVFLKRLGSAGTIRGLSSLLEKKFSVRPDYFDSNFIYLGMSNGWVLEAPWTAAQGVLKYHAPDPRLLISRKLGVSVDDSGEGIPYKFLTHLRATVGTEEEVEYLQMAAGAALLGEGTAKNIPHLVGPPNTFKSAYLRLIKMVFGDYGGTLPASAIAQKMGGSTNFAQSQAQGVRFLYLSEPQTTKVDDSFLKNLSGGGDPISTERKGKDVEEWRAQCVLHIAANHVVKFDTKDDAIVGRMNIVQFTNQVSPDDMNPHLVEELFEEEGEAILWWIIRGAQKFLLNGGVIHIPQIIKDRAKGHVVDSSVTLQWLEELLEGGSLLIEKDAPAYRCVKLKTAWDLFNRWCDENEENRKWVTKNSFHDEIDTYLKTPSHRRGRQFTAQRTTRIAGLLELLESSGIDESGGRASRESLKEGKTSWSDIVSGGSAGGSVGG